MARSGRTSGPTGRSGRGSGGSGGTSGGSGGSSGDIRAGGAFVELFTTDTKLDSGLRSASEKIKSWAAGVAKVGAATIAAGTGILAPLLLSAEQFVDHGDKIKKASDRLGVSAESLSALGYAAAQSGTDIEGLEKGMRKLQQHVYEAANGSKEAYQSFSDLGLAAQDLVDMKPDQMFLAVADAISQIDNPAERTSRVIGAFGKSGAELIPLLLGGAKGVRELMQEASLVGAVFTTDEAAAAERVGDSVERVWTGVKNILKSVGSAVVPLTDNIESLSFVALGHIKVLRDWIEANKGVVIAGAIVGAGLLGLGGVTVGLAATMSVIGVAVGGIGTAISAILSPVGLMTAAVVAGGAAWVAFSENGGESVNTLWNAASTAFNGIISVWQDVVDAIKSNDFATAGKLAFAAFNVEWTKFTQTLGIDWESMLGRMREVLIAWSFAVQDIFSKITTSIAAVMSDIGEGMGVLPAGTTGNVLQDGKSEQEKIQREAVAESQRNAMEARKAAADRLAAAQSEFNSIRKQAREAQAFGGFDFEMPQGGYPQLGIGSSSRGAYNFANAGQFYGGSDTYQASMQKAADKQNELLTEIKAALVGVPLAVMK